MEENNGRIELLGFFKVTKKFFKTNICIVAYTLVTPKKYYAKNLELCGPRNFLFSTYCGKCNETAVWRILK